MCAYFQLYKEPKTEPKTELQTELKTAPKPTPKPNPKPRPKHGRGSVGGGVKKRNSLEHLRGEGVTNSHLLKGEGSLDDVLAHIVVLGQVEELPDLGGTLGPETE